MAQCKQGYEPRRGPPLDDMPSVPGAGHLLEQSATEQCSC